MVVKTLLRSCVCIDEIEEALDFKSLKLIIDYYHECSEDIRFLSRATRLWFVDLFIQKIGVLLKEAVLSFMFSIRNEEEKSPNLEQQLDLFKQQYWDFYRKHISNSDLYKYKPKDK